MPLRENPLSPQLWVHKRKTAPSADLISPVVTGIDDALLNKPRTTGFWTSTLEPDGASAWLRYIEEYEPGRVLHAWVLEPLPQAIVFEIDEWSDLQHLFLNFPLTHIGQLPRAAIEWERVAKEYDAVHFTQHGIEEVRNRDPVAIDWSMESTLWFRWKFESFRYIGQIRLKR